MANHSNLEMYSRSILLGLSIGNPNALDQTPFDKHPNALETPNTTV